MQPPSPDGGPKIPHGLATVATVETRAFGARETDRDIYESRSTARRGRRRKAIFANNQPKKDSKNVA
jgi:hypothetical protein